LNKLLKSLGTAALALLLVACGSGGHNNTPPPTNLRFVNASQSDTLSVNLSGTVPFANTAPGSTSAYTALTSGNYTIAVTGSTGAVVSPAFTVALSGGQNYTLIAYLRDGAVVASLIDETQTTTPPAGYATFGIANISPDSGGLDVYLVTPGTTDLSTLVPMFQSAVYRGSPVWNTLVGGTFDVIVTAAGNANDVRMKLPALQLTSSEQLMLGFTSTAGGALVNGLLLSPGAPAQALQTTNARVRVASALPVAGASPVVATVNGTALGAVFAPNPGVYTVVPGDTSSYAITVAGAPVANLPAATFAAGGDFTILVFGTVAAPAVAVYTDNNQLPAVGSNVKLRLVNAGVNVASGITLYDNSVAVANSVGYGAASPYFGVAPSAASILEIIEPAVTPVSVTMPLSPSGSVYTVFVIDSTLTPYVIRDR